MKTITVDVNEPIYEEFERFAHEQERSTTEVIREAMELYRREKMRPQYSLRNVKPTSAGTVRKPWTGRGDLLADILD
jgi:predicted CopG family antitoxin